MVVLRGGSYLGEISALSFLHHPPNTHSSDEEHPFPFLLAGTGSQLLLYNLDTAKLLKSFHIFRGIRVHGIASTTNNTGGHDDGTLNFCIAVFGERRVKLFRLTIHLLSGNQPAQQHLVHLNLLNRLPKLTHWVLDVSFLTDAKTALGGHTQSLAIGCSDNSVHFWNSLSPQGLTKVLSPDKCLLYSMRMWGDKVENLHIASGTIYNQIIVWKVVLFNHDVSCSVHHPVNSNRSTDKALLHHGQQYQAVHLCKLTGHEGSILRIDWSTDGNRLISVSDDRSARLWEVHGNRKELVNFSEDLGSHSVGPVLFGHNARIWDCCIFDTLIITAGEDCTCRVWGPDGNQLQMIKEHIGRGIWRCLYDPNSSLLVTAGFDSSIKAHKLHDSLFKASGRHSGEVSALADRTIGFTVRIPRASEHIGLMNSKSEYVRCMRFAHENILYVATNNGYLYLAGLSNMGDVKWTELTRVSEAVAIVCMDVLSVSSPNSSSNNEDWVACGDGKGHMTIVSIVRDGHSTKVGVTFTWSAGMERQLLGTYWCKSLGCRFIFTSDPKGILRLWRLGDPSQSASHSCLTSSDVSLIAKYVSCFGMRIMCLDASFQQEVLVCGDLRGNLVLFPLFNHLLLGTSVEPEREISTLNHFRSAHGISSVCSISVASFNSRQVEIQSTGADGCICSLEYDISTQSLDFLGMKQVKEMSLVQCVSKTTSSNDLTTGSHVVGFSSTNFLIWNLQTETKVAQVLCGGWRRPYSYYLGDVPEIQNCFAFVKDEIIHIRSFWIHDFERKIYPQNLHLQFHGREMHSICIISEESMSRSNKVLFPKTCWIATGCEDGTVRLTGYDSSVGEWCDSKLLGEHVGGSSVRSLSYVSTVHEFAGDLSTMSAENTMQQVMENPFLLISVGAKRVLTCWKQKNRAIELKKEAVADETCSGIKFPSGLSSMSFQWLSSDMPAKQCSTREGKERIPTEKKVESDVSSYTDERKLESSSCIGDEYENDWRYLAVTSFLVKISYLRLTVCFVVVACSDATLTVRALVLPYRLWFDIASLVPNSSPTLALQHAVLPVCATSDENVLTKSVYLVIGGSTDGNITFWDLSESVENFIQSLPALQMENCFDCQKRPRTGRGSQGGRWWKTSSQNISSLNPNDSCMSETDVTGAKMLKSDLNGISYEATGTANCKTNCSERKIWPLQVLNGVHQSGINCLHTSILQNGKDSTSGNLYCVLSGGDDQALHSLVFHLQMLPLSQCIENKEQVIVCDASIQGITKNDIQFGQPSNYTVRFCYRDKVPSAHSSAVKGIWTDGSWVFSTGLDQRIRCWLVKDNGKLTERDCLITCVPEPEALDARPCGKDGYQIVVAGRGIQMVEFSALGGMDDNGNGTGL